MGCGELPTDPAEPITYDSYREQLKDYVKGSTVHAIAYDYQYGNLDFLGEYVYAGSVVAGTYKGHKVHIFRTGNVIDLYFSNL